MTTHPLSSDQERQWLVDRMIGETASSDDPTVVRLIGPLSIAALEESWRALTARHDSLRTSFPVEDGVARQVVSDQSLLLPITVVDLAEEHHRSDAELGRFIDVAARRPFDDGVAPLWRVLIVRTSPDDHILAVTLHHMIADLWSAAILVDELCTAYAASVAGCPVNLPPAPAQPAELAERGAARLTAKRRAALRTWWQERLRGARAITLPTTGPRPDRPSLSSLVHESALTTELSDDLRSLARRNGTTLLPLLLAAFASLIARWAAADDVTVVSVSAGRRSVAAERAVGLLTECLVLRLDLTGDPRFDALLRQAGEVVMDALDHVALPFVDLVSLVDPGRDLEPSPLRQVGLSLQNVPFGLQGMAGLVTAPPPPTPVPAGTSEADIWLEVFDLGAGAMGLRLQMDAVLYDRSVCASFERALVRRLSEVAARPEARLSEMRAPAELAVCSQHHPRAGTRGAATPSPEAVTIVCRLVTEVLDLDAAPLPDDNFFRLGGSSIDASRLAARLSDLVRATVHLYDVMTAPTIGGIAAAMQSAATSGGQREVAGEHGYTGHDLDDPLVPGSSYRR